MNDSAALHASTEGHTSTEGHEVPTESLANEGPNGGDILVSVMRDQGVEVAFGVISIHNLPLVQAVDRELRFVPMRHEAAVINAADAYARTTGKIGVALTSTGTGAGNAAGSMLEALTAQSRVLHITGNVNADLIGEHTGAYHEVPRQLAMLQAVSQHALRIETARQAHATLTDAVRLLGTAPHGPVSVDWPIDLQYTANPAEQNKIDDREPTVRTGAQRDLERAAAVLRRAERPLIWAGGGARRVGPALTELAEAWGAGVLTGTNGRGSVPEDHPLVVGNLASDEAVVDLIERADCLLTIGSHLRPSETRNGALPFPDTHVQIDLDADALGRNTPVTVGLQADATVAVPALLALLQDPDEESDQQLATDPNWGRQVAEAAASARSSLREKIGAYAPMCDALRARLPRHAPIVRDVTIPGSSWGNRLLAVHSPTDNVFAAGGGIGQGLAMAVGAAFGRPDAPVLAMVGDGGLAVHLGELGVLAAEQPHVIVVVFNDGGYGVLRNLQAAASDPTHAVDLATPDFATLAQAYGLKHRLVSDPEGFDKALKKALKKDRPSIIEVDVTALDPAPAAMVPPIEVP
ncbi:MAG: thiamine pyrophosphate-binding protein [Propionibacteriaceae bacterium]|nr:thiamine pyrophosphate-binding protein [Propionibacteriaceae bacterium]